MKPFLPRIVSHALHALEIILTVAVISSPANAHAVLVSSSPKDRAVIKDPPKQVVLRFDARIEKPVTQVILFDGKGHKVALPSASHGYSGGPPDRLIIPMPPLKPGAYRLEWRVLATDGHLTPGRIRFTISGRKSP